LNEAELTVSGDAASYKEKLEVLQQQQELIEDEAEQEQEENEAREKAKRDKEEKERSKREEEARKAKDMLPAVLTTSFHRRYSLPSPPLSMPLPMAA
jgi:LETM1 and EF-hand domain-containing protein 1